MHYCNVESKSIKKVRSYSCEKKIESNPCISGAGPDPPGGGDHSPFYSEAGYGREGRVSRTTPYSIQLCRGTSGHVILLSHSEQVTPNNVDIAKVAPKYHLYTPAEVEAVIARL